MDSIDLGDYVIKDAPKAVPVSRIDPYVPPSTTLVELSASITYYRVYT